MSDTSNETGARSAQHVADDAPVALNKMPTAELIKRAESLVADSKDLVDHIALFSNMQARNTHGF